MYKALLLLSILCYSLLIGIQAQSAAQSSILSASTAASSSIVTASGASASTVASNVATASSALSSSVAASQSPPSYDCYCDFTQIPTVSATRPTNNSNYFPGAYQYGSSISNTLNYLAVGAPTQGTNGAIYVYTRFANFPFWTYRTTLTVPQASPSGTALPPNYKLGVFTFVSDDANVVTFDAVSSPRVRSWERSGPNDWVQVQPLFALNITRVFSADVSGRLMVVSFSGRPAGVQVFQKIGYYWSLTNVLYNPEGNGYAIYGQVSIGAQNQFAAITSTSVHVWTRNGQGVWSGQVIPNFNTGSALVAVSISQDRAALAVASSSTIYTFSNAGGNTFGTTPTNTLTGFDQNDGQVAFATIIYLKLSGSFLAVADSGIIPEQLPASICAQNNKTTGAVFVFRRSGSTYTAQNALRPGDRKSVV